MYTAAEAIGKLKVVHIDIYCTLCVKSAFIRKKNCVYREYNFELTMWLPE
jgi:hypothetical protein